MPFNGNGTYTLPAGNPVVNGSVIDAGVQNTTMSDIAVALTDCLTRDGQSPPTANLPMGSHKLTGLTQGSTAGDSVEFSQLQTMLPATAHATGSSDALTGLYAPAVTGLTDGMVLYLRATTANATATPTFAPNALAAVGIVKADNEALVPGDIAGGGHWLQLQYDATLAKWVLNNPANPDISANLPINGFKLTGLGKGSASGDALEISQLQTMLSAISALNVNGAGTASIAVTTGIMTVTAMTGGAFAVGQLLTGTGVPAGTYITAPGTGTGGTGTYYTNTTTAVSSTAFIGSTTGTSDALTGAFVPAVTALTNGMTLYVRAMLANLTTTPTFTPNVSALAAAAIVKGNNQALVTGDIAGGGHWLQLQYDATLAKWVLNNPATGIAPSEAALTSKIQPIAATVASSALTLTLNPTTLDFRSATPGSGAVSTVPNAAAVSLVVPATATLGTVSGLQARLVLLALNNAGAIELAVTNINGGSNLDETALISTTALSTGSTANNVIYSTNARTGLPFRVVGFVDITEATAGIWATAPGTVQGIGGQALAALSSLGYGQNWYALSRAMSVTYYNTTGKPIVVSVGLSNGSVNALDYLVVNGVVVDEYYQAGSVNGGSVSGIVPVGGAYYAVNGGASPAILYWSELR